MRILIEGHFLLIAVGDMKVIEHVSKMLKERGNFAVVLNAFE